MDKVLEFIENLEDENLRLICSGLHDWITSNLEPCEYDIKWNIPFYMHYGNLCYMNPRKKKVDLGFYHGAKLEDIHGIFRGDGVQVKHIHLFKPKDVYNIAVADMILSAAEYNRLLNDVRRK